LSSTEEKRLLETTRPPVRGRGALGWVPAGAPEPVSAARGYYLLRQWPAAAAAVGHVPELPGAGVILALALARMGEEDAARAAFAAAVAVAPEDPHLRCAHAAFLLRGGRGAEALGEAEAGLGVVEEDASPRVPLLSARGAAHWLLGQEAVARGEDRRAVAAFEQAARSFLAAGASPARSLSEWLAAAYVGQAVAMVAAGQYASAPRLFARQQAQGMAATPALARFARDLYELCDLTPRLPEAERPAAGHALRPVLSRAVLRASLWDGGCPLILAWYGLPGGDAAG
jgi:hypothetical protein